MGIVTPAGPFKPTWDSLTGYRVPDWYMDAKFGIFIHWGVYAVPAFGNEWYPRNMYCQGSREFEHHVATYGPQSEFGYKDFIPEFTAAKFDPKEWARLFRDAGARYVVPVAEHHDGFQLYESALSDWNAMRMGPKRDIIGELAQATRDEGMVFGVSSHRAEHWWFMNGGREFDSDVQDPQFAALYGPAKPKETQPDEEYLEDWLARCCELVDKYRPQVFWFDWWIEDPAFRPYLKRFAAYYYNRAAEWGTGVAINYKNDAYPPSAAVFDIERGKLENKRDYFWQTDTSVSFRSWGYIENDEFRTVASVVHDLADIVSKNGCLLLNVGPRADGTIPDEAANCLRGVGKWLAANGEAIYGTRPWVVYGEGETPVPAGFREHEQQPYTVRDVRFTTSASKLYAIALGVPADRKLTIQSLSSSLKLYAGEIADVSLLGYSGTVEWSRDAAGLHVTLPGDAALEHAVTLAITPEMG